MINTNSTSQLIDRRKLLRMGASVSGAALVAALPVVPATAAQPASGEIEEATQDPIVGYWAARNRLYAEARRVLDEVDVLHKAGDERWREKERFADELRHQGYELEGIIADLTPVSAEGWHIQCLILMTCFEIGPRGDGADEAIAERLRDHFANMAGVKNETSEAQAPTVASTEELLTRYNCWLAYEHRRLAIEMYPDHPNADRYVPMDRHATFFHWPYDRQGNSLVGSSPSSRALAVLALAGVFTGPEEADPRAGKTA